MHVRSGKEVEALIDLYRYCSPSENEVSVAVMTRKVKEREALRSWRVGSRGITLLVTGEPYQFNLVP